MELARIWEVILGRKWIIIQSMFVIGLVAFLVSFLMRPSYTASSKILLLKAQKGVIDIGSVGSQLASIIKTSADVDVNRVMASSRPYVDQMVNRLQLRDEDGNLIKAYEPQLSPFKERFFPKPYVSVAQYRDTDILVVRADSPDPEEAMMMANTLSGIMVEQNQIIMRAEYKSAREFLEKQVEIVKKQYETSLLELANFQKKEQTIDLKIETKLASEKLMELLKEKEDNIIDLAQARAKLSHLQKELDKQTPEYISSSALQASPQLVVLKKELIGLRIKLAEARSELTENHPRVLSLLRRIKMAESELGKEIKVYRETAPELVGLQKQIVSLEAHLKAVNADVERYFEALGGIPDKAYKQANIDKELGAARQTYASLLEFLYQMGIAEASTLSEIRIIEEAERPLVPEGPKELVNGIIGTIVGFLFGFGLVFLLEYLDQSIKRVEDVKSFRPIPLIGAIPKLEDEPFPLITMKDPNDPFSESYRKIRNHMVAGEKPINSLLITSPGPGEGKSTTVVNLGVCYAREGKKVVLLDMDLRRPNLHTYFDFSNDIGIADLLQGKSTMEEALHATGVEGLSIIPSGPAFADPGRLIASDNMPRLMANLSHRFDMVIMDSAPGLVKSDALILGGYVDSSIIMLERGKTTRRAVHELLESMARARMRPTGFVLNGFVIPKGTYSYQRFYYGHYGDEVSVGQSL